MVKIPRFLERALMEAAILCGWQGRRWTHTLLSWTKKRKIQGSRDTKVGFGSPLKKEAEAAQEESIWHAFNISLINSRILCMSALHMVVTQEKSRSCAVCNFIIVHETSLYRLVIGHK